MFLFFFKFKTLFLLFSLYKIALFTISYIKFLLEKELLIFREHSQLLQWR